MANLNQCLGGLVAEDPEVSKNDGHTNSLTKKNTISLFFHIHFFFACILFLFCLTVHLFLVFGYYYYYYFLIYLYFSVKMDIAETFYLRLEAVDENGLFERSFL